MQPSTQPKHATGVAPKPAALRGPMNWLKRAVYELGVLDVYHRVRNRTHFTCVIFHRVLPRDSAEWQYADRNYTLDTETFAACLEFLQRHYNPITLAQLELPKRGRKRFRRDRSLSPLMTVGVIPSNSPRLC